MFIMDVHRTSSVILIADVAVDAVRFLDQLARQVPPEQPVLRARRVPLEQQEPRARQVPPEQPALRERQVPLAPPALRERRVPLPRQYMHNKENAVTMRLSAH